MRTENNIAINDELLVRYLAGEATPEEALALEDWVREPENRGHLDNLRDTWHAARPSMTPRVVNKEKAWEVFDKKLGNKTSAHVLNRYPLHIKIAASILFVIAAGLVVYTKFRMSTQPEYILLSTADSIRQINLSDGSTATLCRNTVMEYPQVFNGEQRQVHLSYGEAFFSVSANPQKPFVIATPTAFILVVGTAFNVAATEDNLEVSVAEGKVMIYNDLDTTFLQPGMTATFHAGRSDITVSDAADANHWGYATGKFVFNDTPLRDVIATLQKAYACVLTTSNKDLENCRVNGTFTNDSIENIVHLIAESMTLSVTKNGSEFILEGKGCP